MILPLDATDDATRKKLKNVLEASGLTKILNMNLNEPTRRGPEDTMADNYMLNRMGPYDQ